MSSKIKNIQKFDFRLKNFLRLWSWVLGPEVCDVDNTKTDVTKTDVADARHFDQKNSLW